MLACPAFGRVLIVRPEPCVTFAVGNTIGFLSYAAIAAMKLCAPGVACD
jgi:hypothetical protein